MIKTLLDSMEKKPMNLLRETTEQINQDPSFLNSNSLPFNHNENSGFKQIDSFNDDEGQNKIITPPKF